MFGSRRLAKRSIIGTRVSAPWQDGRFYPGIIQTVRPGPAGPDLYEIVFDDGYMKNMTDKDVIGPGFQPVTGLKLKHGQKVYITYNGREYCGLVIAHDTDTDEVEISVRLPDLSETVLIRRLEDVRLLESRKSARLQDQDTDYSRLADAHPEPKKRAVSHVIDVPSLPVAKSRRRKNSPEPEDGTCADDVDMMDEHTAAMVLTSLSCSPVSPKFPTNFFDKAASFGSSETPLGSSFNSSGVFSIKSEPNTPSPPMQLSESAPAATMIFAKTPVDAIDEGIGLDESSAYFTDESAPKKRRSSTRTVFKCQWPSCGKLLNTCAGIEKHVRQAHLGPKEMEDSDMSDHEEEFYYTEIEVTVDTVTETFADMHTSSPPQNHFMEMTRCTMQDHDYQRKEPKSTPQNIPARVRHLSVGESPTACLPMSISIPTSLSQVQRSLSWQLSTSAPDPNSVSTPIKITRPGCHQSQSPKTHILSSSPKSSPMHKKSRSEVKKCRKVYGMENRDMWCTQCKWKKACSRFLD